MILYLTEFFLLHSLFYLVYKAFLSRETQLGFLRAFLIGSTVLSLVIPIVEIPTSSSLPTLSLNTIILPMIEVDPINTTSAPRYTILFISVSLVHIQAVLRFPWSLMMQVSAQGVPQVSKHKR